MLIRTKEQNEKLQKTINKGLDVVNSKLEKENLSAAEIEALAKLIDSLNKL